MSNNQIVINPSTSGLQVTIDFPISSEHKKLVFKFREILKSPEQPLELNSLFNAKLVALLTEEDLMLGPFVSALQNKVETINANSLYLNHFKKDLHESDGKLVIHLPFELQ